MGKHGETVVEEMLLGSVTRRIPTDSKRDALIVRGEPMTVRSRAA